MKLYLQFGYGMKRLCEKNEAALRECSVVLSPRDLTPGQAIAVGKNLGKTGGRVWFDPQMYAPRSERGRLSEYDYRPQGFQTDSTNWNTILDRLHALNDDIGTTEFILPCRFLEKIGDVRDTVRIVEKAMRFSGPKLASLCLASPILMDPDSTDILLNGIGAWPVDGFYLIAEHPEHGYFSDNPIWLANLLKLCAGIKAGGKRLVVGYCNQQMLCLSCAGVDAIASGTWANVRSFSLRKFEDEDETVKRKKAWYYCPETLSEFSLPFLDVASRNRILSYLRPPAGWNASFADVLFSGAIPSDTGFNEPAAFRHYLFCLSRQCEEASHPSFRERLSQQLAQLEKAKKNLSFLHRHGVRGQNRDFEEIIDVNQTALGQFANDHSFLLDRRPDLFRT